MIFQLFNISFESPWWLLLLVLPVLFLFAGLKHQIRPRAAAGRGNSAARLVVGATTPWSEAWSQAQKQGGPWRGVVVKAAPALPLWLRCAALALAVVALARPQAGPRAFTLLLLSQPGLALATQILDPQTVTLGVETRTTLTSWFVLTALAQTGLALCRQDPLRIVFGVALSQAALLVAGAMASEHGFTAEYLMLAGSDLGLLALALLLGDLVRRHGSLRLRPDNGLAEHEPRSAQLFLVAGWLFAGLPGGIVFFAEDLIFHALVQRSSWNAAGMVFASVLNAIAFYRVYLGVYCGRMTPGAFAKSRMPASVYVAAVLLVAAVVVFGCMPQAMLPH